MRPRVVWMVAGIACAPAEDTEPPVVETPVWQSEAIGSWSEAGPVRIGARPDGSLWIVTGSAIAWEKDVECAEGYLGGSVTFVFEGKAGAWGPAMELRTSRHGVWPSDHVAVACHPTEGALTFAWPAGEGDLAYCGPHDLAVGGDALAPPRVRGNLTRDADGALDLVGFWPAVVVREDGSFLAVYQRHRVTSERRSSVLELVESEGQPRRLSERDEIGRYPALVLDSDQEPSIVAADLTNAYALSLDGSEPQRLGGAPLAHPDLVLQPDGTIEGVYVEATTGETVRLVRDREGAWSASTLQLPVRSPRRVAIESRDGRRVYAWAADGEVHLALEDEAGMLEHEVLPNPHGQTCTDADVVMVDGAAHIVSYCVGQVGEGRSIFHAWKPI